MPVYKYKTARPEWMAIEIDEVLTHTFCDIDQVMELDAMSCEGIEVQLVRSPVKRINPY